MICLGESPSCLSSEANMIPFHPNHHGTPSSCMKLVATFRKNGLGNSPSHPMIINMLRISHIEIRITHRESIVENNQQI